MVTEEREQKIKSLIAKRQQHLTIILENVHDPHNLGAVMRTCDTVGIHEIYALYTIENPKEFHNMIGHNSSSGSKKWVDVHFFEDVNACFDAVRTKYKRIYGTHLSDEAVGLYDLDLAEPTALLFGNEHRGVSKEALALLDGNFIIRQSGMVQSLNISVACAVSLFEAKRQRMVKGMYDQPFDNGNAFHQELYARYIKSSKPKYGEELG